MNIAESQRLHSHERRVKWVGGTSSHLCQTPLSLVSASSRTPLPLESPRLTVVHISPLPIWLRTRVWHFDHSFFYFFLNLSLVYQGISYTHLFQVSRSVSSDILHSYEVTTIVTIWNITITPGSSSHCPDSKPLLAPPWQHWVDFCPHGFAFSRMSCKWNQSICVAFCVWLLSPSKCFWESSVLLWV